MSMIVRGLSVAVLLLLLSVGPVQANYQADIGFSMLQESAGSLLPDGSGTPVTQVEAPSSGHWLPNPNDAEFSGKTIENISGDDGYSGHATTVGKYFYGNSLSQVPGVSFIHAYEANDWLLYNFLNYIYGWQPGSCSSRVANHSWVGSMTSEHASGILKRLDWVVAMDDYVQVASTLNSASNMLLGNAYNVIAVGRTDGSHYYGSVALDAVYTAGRSRPDIVAPMGTLSYATPVVASAATLLIAVGADAALSADPLESSTTNREGELIYNAQRAEVIKAALMAGADRFTRNTSFAADITDYRLSDENCKANGLDIRFGAGQVNVESSYWIIAAGEQNSLEDDPTEGGLIGHEGFDYDPAFGGLSGSNRTASYTFATDDEHRLLSASLVWHLFVNGGTQWTFDDTTTLYNFDLLLIDVTAGNVEIASSASKLDNTENLFIALEANHEYTLQVIVGDDQANFNWDYALAWQLSSDVDADTIPDRLDNCVKTANAEQADTDDDGYGNICDCDLNNDGIVNFIDYGSFRTEYGTTGENLDSDFNSDGIVNFLDFGIFKYRYGTEAPFE